MTHYNLSNNPSLIFSSQQPVIPPQDLPAPPPIPNELQLIEAVEHNDAAAVQYLLQEVYDPTSRRDAYLTAYQLGHIDIALILLKAGAPLIGSLETLAYNAINQGKYNSVSFNNLSAYIREHGLSFNLNNRHGPKQESLQECAARIGSHLVLAWLDQFLISTEGAVYHNEFSDQNDFHLPSLGLPDQADSIGNNNDPWNFLIGFEGFDQSPGLSEDPTLSLIPVDYNFDPSFLSDIPINVEPLPNSSAQSLSESSEGIPGNFIDLTLSDDTPELPFLSLDRICATQEIDHFNSQWLKAIKESNCDNLLSLLQQAKQKRIPFVKYKAKLSALHLACIHGHSQLVKLLIESKADLNVTDNHKDTPLHKACMHGHLEAAKLLIEAKASINDRNITGDTPLDVASTPEIRELLEAERAAQQASLHQPPSQQEIDQFNRDWVKALAQTHCTKLLSLLQQARQKNILLNVDAKMPGFLTTPLHLACGSGDSELVRLLIEAKADIHAKDNNGYSPFYLACSRGHSDVVKQLIAAKANINEKNHGGSTALHVACGFGNTDVVRQLLAAGASIDAKDANGKTPLNVAITTQIRQLLENARAAQQTSLQPSSLQQKIDQFNKEWISNLSSLPINRDFNMTFSLLQKAKQMKIPFKIDAQDQMKRTTLHYACLYGSSDLVKLLIDAKASINLADSGGLTPLHHACNRKGGSEVIRQLIDADAARHTSLYIDARDHLKRTALHCAVLSENHDSLKLLIDAKASVNLADAGGLTPLHHACSRKGGSEAVRQLIGAKALVNSADPGGLTPLHYACLYGNSDVVKLLIDAKASVNLVDKGRNTPLHIACKYGQSEIVRQLLAAGASIDAKDDSGKTPRDVASTPGIRQLLENARTAQQASLQRFLLNQFNKDWSSALTEGNCSKLYSLLQLARQKKIPCNLDVKNKDELCAMHLGCIHGHSQLVKLLIEAKANLNAKDKDLNSPLHLACRNGHTELVRQLIKAKANINDQDKFGDAPLHEACMKGNLQIAELLIEAGAILDQRGLYGNTPLHDASSEGHSEIVKLLIQAKAKVNDRNQKGNSPLHIACRQGHSDVVEYLLAAGAGIDGKNKKGETPFEVAKTDEIRQLLRNACTVQQASLQPTPSQQEIDQLNRDWSSALSKRNFSKLPSLLQQARQENILLNVDAQNSLKYTALHIACFYRDTALVKLLIDAKASVNLADQYGLTPLHFASFNGHSEVVRQLIGAHASVNLRDENGHTPLHCASFKGHPEVVRQLLDAGASIEAKNSKSKTALDYASTPEIKQLLQAAQLKANSKTPAPDQSRTPNPRKLERAGKQLLKRVAEHYGPIYHTALTELLIKNRGHWGIDFARYSSRRIDKREWLAPFVQFLEAHPGSATASQVVKQHLAFFQFSDSSDREVLTDDVSSAESFVEKCLKENALQPRAGRAPLSDYFAVEACQTLFSLKLREWNYMVNHPERYFPAPERLTDANSPLCPCFILAQDQNQVRAHIMQAHFGKMGFVESFGKDIGQEALRFLFTEVLKCSEVPSGRIREDESAVLSWEEYNLLERYLAELPSSGLPKLLVPMREKLVQPIEEVSETDSSSDETGSASDEEPSYRRGQDREERPAKRRERSPDERPEQDSLPKSFNTFNDLISSRTSEKRTTRENDRVSSKTKRHRKNAYEAPEHQGAFASLEEQLIRLPADVRSKRQRKGDEGEIPEVGSFAGLPSLNDDQSLAFSDNPYDTLNRTSIKKIKEAVAREVARESVVLRQIKPYSYPIVDKLSDLPAAKPSFSWTRSLKPYQQETLQDLLRYDSHGLSKLLSLEMGLGKTYVFAEFLIDKIATSPSPQLYVVSAPVSVVGQVQQELSKLLLEASITAWQLTGKRPSSPELWPQCKQLLDYANNHPDALKSVLRVLPYFKDAHVYGVPASNQFFSQPGLQRQLFSMTQEHLVEIETLLQERPEEREQFEKQLDAIYKDLNLRNCSKQELLCYFKTSQPIVKLCNIAGRILDLYPGRAQLSEPLPICSDRELASLRNLGLSPSQIEKEHFINAWAAKKSDPELKSLSDTPAAPKICLIGLKDLHKVRDQFPRKHVGSLIIDEANRAQNRDLTTSKQLRETIASFRKSAFEGNDSNNVLLVTGTPFENNLNELWNLLQLSNPDNLLPRTTCNSLMKDTLLTTIRQMINLCGKGSKANEDLIEQYVLISFAQFMGLRNMVQKMVHRKDTSDPQVIEDWKGRIPSKSIRKILYELDPQMRDYLNEVQEGRRSLSQRSVQTQILIHPDLAGQSLDAQENNGWPFLEPFRTGSDEVKEAWIKSSPYLSAVLTDAVFQASMTNNQKRIIFCDRNALSAAFKETIKHFYQNAKVIIYNGDLKRLERDKAIAKFKNESSDHPTVLIAMIKAGGVGLNLAEADGRHICATQWNEGQKRQADARLIRANNVGEKDMPEIEFPDTYYSAHPKAIRKKKRNWENFLWNSSESAKDLFQSWTTVLKAETLQVLLNTTIEDGNRRNTESAKAKNLQISDLLDKFCDSIPEDRLNRAISLAMGPSSSAGIEQSPSPTELSDDPATSTSEEERTPSPTELSDDFAPAAAELINAPVGLGNKSNNCWCNALLQMVASTPSLRACYESFARHYISNATALSSGFAASSSSPQRSYLDEYYGQAMLSALDLYDRSEEALSPDISQNVREALNHFSSGAISIASSHNEDAYEALSILLQGSEPNSSLYTPLSTIRTYSPIRGLPALPDPRKLANNEYSTLEEGNCSTMTAAVPEILLPLQENENVSFSNLLGQFFDTPAQPDTPPSIYLKGYGLFKYQLQRIQNQFQSVPHEFLLQLGRFRKEGPQDEPVLHKINTPVAVPLTLTLPQEAFASLIAPPPSYQLDSFIVHTGELEGGHYFTYKKLEGQWWLCNDSHVEPVALEEIEGILNGGMTTYLHHYTKQA